MNASRTSMIATIGGGLGAALALVLGLWWLIDPSQNSFANQVDPLALTHALPRTISAALLTGVGTLGLLTAMALLVSSRRPAGRRSLPAVPTAIVALGFFVLISDASLLMMMGYVLAGVLPLGVIALVVLVWRRSVPFRFVAVLLAAALAAWAWAMPSVTLDSALVLPGMLAGLLMGIPASDLLLLPFTAALAAWGLLLFRSVRDTAMARRSAESVHRARVPLTWIAALCPAPYVLLRLTWLTPGQNFGPADMDGDLRIWGLLLGGAAALGSVLTIGLLCRWGRVFPAWMPRIGGRQVPVATAVVPATLVGAAVTVAAAPMLINSAQLGTSELLSSIFVFPFWLWGPTLLLATWAYARHRAALRQAQGTSGQAQGTSGQAQGTSGQAQGALASEQGASTQAQGAFARSASR